MQFHQVEALKIWQYLGNNEQSFVSLGKDCLKCQWLVGIINLRFSIAMKNLRFCFIHISIQERILKSK